MSTTRTKTARTFKTEAAILNGLAQLITQFPVAKISLSALAKQSGLTRSTVYNQVTSVSNAVNLIAEQLWIEAEAIAGQSASLSANIAGLIDWIASDSRIQGFRTHNPAAFQEVLASLCRLDNDTHAARVTEVLMRWSVAADLDTATTFLRWISTWAIEPGSARERESASELFAKVLILDVQA